MTSDHKRGEKSNEGDDGSDDSEDKPTIVPQFDPEAFAREFVDHGTPADDAEEIDDDINDNPTVPPPNEYRDKFSTLTDEAELEHARMLSANMTVTNAPPSAELPESMRSSLLSLANARAPSIVPPKPAIEPWQPMDKGWEELTLDDPDPGGKSAAEAHLSRQTAASPTASIQDRTLFKSAAATNGAAPSGEFTVWAPGTTAAAAAALVRETLPTPVPAPVPPESSSNAIAPARAQAGLEGPEPTVFSPARARAAATAPATRNPNPVAAAEPAPAEAPTAPAGGPEDILREMRDRFSLGDYTGALVLAEGLLEDDHGNGEVLECAESCRAVLRQMYTARIGPLDRVPVVSVARDQLRWLSIDHRAGFVLSHIDGISSLEMILDVSGMPLLDALRILCELAQQRIISFR